MDPRLGHTVPYCLFTKYSHVEARNRGSCNCVTLTVYVNVTGLVIRSHRSEVLEVARVTT